MNYHNVPKDIASIPERLEEYKTILDKWLKTHNLDSLDYYPYIPGMFGLGDWNRAMIEYPKSHNGNHPTIAIIGKHELIHLRSCACSHGTILPELPFRKGLAKEIEARKPFTSLGLRFYPVEEFSRFLLLTS